jgi:hypothetical protein
VPYYLAIQRISGVRVPEHVVRLDRLERYGAIDPKLVGPFVAAVSSVVLASISLIGSSSDIDTRRT